MQKNFALDIDGQTVHFTARSGIAHDVGIYQDGAAKPCVVLSEGNALERSLNALVDKEELLDLAILQTVRQGLIERAKQTGEQVHESLVFVPNPG
jgi:hypothetical protein